MCNTNAPASIIQRQLALMTLISEIEDLIGAPSVSLGGGKWSEGAGLQKELGWRRGRERKAINAMTGKDPQSYARAEARAKEQGIDVTTVLSRDMRSAQRERDDLITIINKNNEVKTGYTKELNEIFTAHPELKLVSMDDLQLHLDRLNAPHAEPDEQSATASFRLAQEQQTGDAHVDELTAAMDAHS